jgi:hypothetical protein
MERNKNVADVTKITSIQINDLTFAAYLSMRGCTLISAKKFGKSFKFEFVCPENFNQMKIDFVNSEIRKFDDEVRSLKRLLFSDNRDD